MRTSNRFRWIVVGEILLLLLQQGELTVAAEPAPGVAEFPDLSADNDWPWWRGPTRNGVAAAGQSSPLHWSDGRVATTSDGQRQERLYCPS